MRNIFAIPKLITEKEAARMLDISLATIRRVRDSGKIAFQRVSKSIRYTEADLFEYLDNGRVPCKTSNTPDKAESTGCHSEQVQTPGAGLGSTSVHDKQGAHRLAQKIFSRPKSSSLNGL